MNNSSLTLQRTNAHMLYAKNSNTSKSTKPAGN